MMSSSRRPSKSGQHLTDPRQSRQRAVHRVDQRRDAHQRERAAERRVAALDDQRRHPGRRHQAESREQMDAPGEYASRHTFIISASYTFANCRAWLTREVSRETTRQQNHPGATAGEQHGR